MAEAVYKGQGCGWRKRRQRTVWWTQCIRSQDVAGGRETGTVWWTQCVRSQDMAGGRTTRGLYDGRNVSGASMGLEEGATEDSMVEAMYKEQGCG